MKKNSMITLIIIILIIFFIDFSASWTSYRSGNKYQVKYIGLFWVIADHYTIWKYESDDTPKQWITYKKKNDKSKN